MQLLSIAIAGKHVVCFWDKARLISYFDIVMVDEERHDPCGAF